MKSLETTLSLLIAATAIPAFAQPIMGHMDSLELRVDRAEVVVAGRITKLERLPGEYDFDKWFMATVKVDETLKGAKQGEVRFVIRSIDGVGKTENWAKHGTRLMFFLVPSRLLASNGTVFRPPDQKREWAYARERNAPVGGYDENSVFELDPAAKVQAFTIDLRPLSHPDDLLNEARKAAKRSSPARVAVTDLNIESAIYADVKLDTRSFTGGFALSVPIDDRLEIAARTWLKSPRAQRRLSGVESLVYFRSSENAALLRAFQADPDKAVAQAARLVLEAWGMP